MRTHGQRKTEKPPQLTQTRDELANFRPSSRASIVSNQSAAGHANSRQSTTSVTGDGALANFKCRSCRQTYFRSEAMFDKHMSEVHQGKSQVFSEGEKGDKQTPIKTSTPVKTPEVVRSPTPIARSAKKPKTATVATRSKATLPTRAKKSMPAPAMPKCKERAVKRRRKSTIVSTAEESTPPPPKKTSVVPPVPRQPTAVDTAAVVDKPIPAQPVVVQPISARPAAPADKSPPIDDLFDAALELIDESDFSSARHIVMRLIDRCSADADGPRCRRLLALCHVYGDNHKLIDAPISSLSSPEMVQRVQVLVLCAMIWQDLEEMHQYSTAMCRAIRSCVMVVGMEKTGVQLCSLLLNNDKRQLSTAVETTLATIEESLDKVREKGRQSSDMLPLPIARIRLPTFCMRCFTHIDVNDSSHRACLRCHQPVHQASQPDAQAAHPDIQAHGQKTCALCTAGLREEAREGHDVEMKH